MLKVLPLLVTTSGVTPIDKVVSMLEELEQQVITEGKAEAETYEKFACFCKDNAAEKTTAITDGEKLKSSQEAALTEAQVTRDNESQNKADAAVSISTLKREIKEERAARRDAHNKYAETILDLEKAIQSAEEAEKLILSSNTGPAMIHMKKTVKRALLLAVALGAHVKTAFLDQPFDPATEDYSFHSSEVLTILKDLHKKFVTEKNTADEKEIAEKKAHDELVQGKHDELEVQKVALADAEKAIQAKTKLIGDTQAQFTETNAKLLDDQAYLQELTTNCNNKAATWQERTAARSGELSALHQATMIIKDQVATIGTGPTEGLVLLSDKPDAPKPTEGLVLLSEPDAPDAAPTSFVQILDVPVARHAKFLATRSALSRVAAMLRSKSARRNSSLLKFAATVAEKDPLDKVKTLIQELITRLQEEASSEQDHHNWCTGETKKAEQTRTIKVDEIREFNALLAKGESRRDQLTEALDTLNTEITELDAALTDAQAVRDQENVEYLQSIKDADAGRQAVSEAIQVLQTYYQGAKGTSLISQPDAGFKNDEAYAGAQGAASGILGMMDVIRGDFVRQKDLAEKDEKSAVAAFTEFKSTTNASLAAKRTQEGQKKADLNAEDSEIQTNRDSLHGSQGLLDGAIKELIQLHEACVAGTSHEERAAARDEEISALKEALCILDKQGPVSTMSC